MKASNKILLNEYKGKLRKIMTMHPSDSIRFNQFMELLTINGIRSYSKDQISKIAKFFDNPLKICRIQVPLSYLSLQCVQQSDKKKYFVVKVSSSLVNPYIFDAKQKKHNTSKCLQTFVKILRRSYGSQRNWFKVLGGLTISVSIDQTTFKKSITKILCNTSHSNCAQDLVQLFLRQSNSRNIQWRSFMKIVNNAMYFTGYQFSSEPKVRSSFLAQSLMSTDLFPNKNNNQRRSSLLSAQSRQGQSATQKVYPDHKKSNQSQKQEDAPRFFSLSAKQCTLFQKIQARKSIVQSIKNTHNKFTHRKCKTQSNFFDAFKLQQKQTQIETTTVVQNPTELTQKKRQQRRSCKVYRLNENVIKIL